MSYIDIDNMIERDIETLKMYQLQYITNEKKIKFTFINNCKANNIPKIVLFTKTIDNIDCCMVSYLETLEHKNKFLMLGYILQQNNITIGNLNFVFVPDITSDEIINENILYTGHYEIILNDVVLKKLDTYKEPIYILTEYLINDVQHS
jgi:hypothetical protein